MKLNKVEPIVKTILENEPESRGDDEYLYYLFCTQYGFLTDSNFTRMFKDKEYRNKLGIASFKSVERSRRKIQAENENLKPSEEVEQARMELEQEYREYSIS